MTEFEAFDAGDPNHAWLFAIDLDSLGSHPPPPLVSSSPITDSGDRNFGDNDEKQLKVDDDADITMKDEEKTPSGLHLDEDGDQPMEDTTSAAVVPLRRNIEVISLDSSSSSDDEPVEEPEEVTVDQEEKHEQEETAVAGANNRTDWDVALQLAREPQPSQATPGSRVVVTNPNKQTESDDEENECGDENMEEGRHRRRRRSGGSDGEPVTKKRRIIDDDEIEDELPPLTDDETSVPLPDMSQPILPRRFHLRRHRFSLPLTDPPNDSSDDDDVDLNDDENHNTSENLDPNSNNLDHDDGDDDDDDDDIQILAVTIKGEPVTDPNALPIPTHVLFPQLAVVPAPPRPPAPPQPTQAPARQVPVVQGPAPPGGPPPRGPPPVPAPAQAQPQPQPQPRRRQAVRRGGRGSLLTQMKKDALVIGQGQLGADSPNVEIQQHFSRCGFYYQPTVERLHRKRNMVVYAQQDGQIQKIGDESQKRKAAAAFQDAQHTCDYIVAKFQREQRPDFKVVVSREKHEDGKYHSHVYTRFHQKSLFTHPRVAFNIEGVKAWPNRVDRENWSIRYLLKTFDINDLEKAIDSGDLAMYGFRVEDLIEQVDSCTTKKERAEIELKNVLEVIEDDPKNGPKNVRKTHPILFYKDYARIKNYSNTVIDEELESNPQKFEFAPLSKEFWAKIRRMEERCGHLVAGAAWYHNHLSNCPDLSEYDGFYPGRTLVLCGAVDGKKSATLRSLSKIGHGYEFPFRTTYHDFFDPPHGLITMDGVTASCFGKDGINSHLVERVSDREWISVRGFQQGNRRIRGVPLLISTNMSEAEFISNMKVQTEDEMNALMKRIRFIQVNPPHDFKLLVDEIRAVNGLRRFRPAPPLPIPNGNYRYDKKGNILRGNQVYAAIHRELGFSNRGRGRGGRGRGRGQGRGESRSDSQASSHHGRSAPGGRGRGGGRGGNHQALNFRGRNGGRGGVHFGRGYRR